MTNITENDLKTTYDKLIELELDNALREARNDKESGHYKTESVGDAE